MSPEEKMQVEVIADNTAETIAQCLVNLARELENTEGLISEALASGVQARHYRNAASEIRSGKWKK